MYSVKNEIVFLDKAVSFQKKALKLDPASARMWADLAWLYLARNDVRNASSSMTEAVKNDRLNANYPAALIKIFRRYNNEK